MGGKHFACHQHSDYKLLNTASSQSPAGRGLRIYPNVRLGFIIGASYEFRIGEASLVDIRESGMSVLLLGLEDYDHYVNEGSVCTTGVCHSFLITLLRLTFIP